MHIVRSQHTDALADALADLLAAGTGSPFEADEVVVSGGAVERWLRLHIARRNGICANVRFVSPAEMLVRALDVIGAPAGGGTTATEPAGVPAAGDGAWGDADPWTPMRVAWVVSRLLPAHLHDPRFAPLRHYLEQASPGSARYTALAQRIGEMFVRYLVHRPEMVLGWESGGDVHDWQSELWRATRAAIGVPHVAERWARAHASLAAAGHGPAAVPRRLVWFVVPGVARRHIEAARALAHAGVAVHLFMQLPWRGGDGAGGMPGHGPGDAAFHDRRRNPLLVSMGARARELEALVAGAAGAGAFAVADAWRTPGETTMLAQLQRDVLAGTRRGRAEGDAPPVPVSPGDTSVRVHACHSLMRQVEVLRDELLHLFNDDPTLTPRDVVLLSPSLDASAPLLSAVFPDDDGEGRAGAGADAPAIPLQILDRPFLDDNPIGAVVRRLLQLAGERATGSAILDLLALSPVAARFGLRPADRDTFLAWIRASGVRWAIDGDDRAARGLPPSDANTWRHALDRLLVGWALPGDGEVLFESVAPYDEIEGNDAELLGRFCDACTWAFDRIRRLQEPRPPAEWSATLAALADELTGDADEPLAWPAHEFRAVAGRLAREAQRADANAPIDLPSLRLWLDAALGERRTEGSGSRNAVRVSALAPGRTTPARVVVILGADDEHFPRPRAMTGFDRLVRELVPGDPDPPGDDRARFLEAIMAAGERLIITYTGRSIESDAAIAPAVPVAELLDTIDGSFVAAGDAARARASQHVVVAHPMQAFSPRNFGAEGGGALPRSYDRAFLAAATALQHDRHHTPRFLTRPPTRPEEVGPGELDVDDLARTIEHPSRALLQRRLGVYLDVGDDPLPDRDPVTLDVMAAARIRDTLVRRALDRGEGEQGAVEPALLLPLVRATGDLPDGEGGVIDFEECAGDASALVDAHETRRNGESPRTVTIDLSLGDVRLTGRAGALFGATQLLWRGGTLRPPHYLSAWVRHLAVSATLEANGEASNITTVLLGRPRTVSAVTFAPVADAAALLADLVTALDAERAGAIPFFPETSLALVRAMDDPGDGAAFDARVLRDALYKARTVFSPTYGVRRMYCEGNDPYVTRLFGTWEPGDDPGVDDAFVRVAQRIWRPALAAMTVEGGR